MEISKKISAMLSEGGAAPAIDEVAEEPPADESEDAAVDTEPAPTPVDDEAPAEPEAADEDAAAAEEPQRRAPPATPADAGIEEEGEDDDAHARAVTAPIPTPPADDADDGEAVDAEIRKLPDRAPRTAPPPRPKRRRPRPRPSAPANAELESAAAGIEEGMAKKQKLIRIGKYVLVGFAAFFFGWVGHWALKERAIYNQQTDDARFLRDRINDVYSELGKLQEVYIRKERKGERFTQELVNLMAKKGPDSIAKKFRTILTDIDARLRNMPTQTIADIIAFHGNLTLLGDAIKDHANGLDGDDWKILLKYSSAKEIPKVNAGVVVDPPEEKAGVDIVLERGEVVIIQEITRKGRTRIYKVHKIGRSLPLYQLTSEQIQMANLHGYVEDEVHRAIDKYNKGEKKIRRYLDELMKSRAGLTSLIQKAADREKLKEL